MHLRLYIDFFVERMKWSVVKNPQDLKLPLNMWDNIVKVYHDGADRYAAIVEVDGNLYGVGIEQEEARGPFNFLRKGKMVERVRTAPLIKGLRWPIWTLLFEVSNYREPEPAQNTIVHDDLTTHD